MFWLCIIIFLMHTFHFKNDELELGLSVDKNQVIQMRMSGNLSSDHRMHLLAWGEKVRETVCAVSEVSPDRVFCLVNLTGGMEADMETLVNLIELMRHNKHFVTKTAVYGATPIMKSFVDISLKATDRTNMKTFTTRTEAEKWLFS